MLTKSAVFSSNAAFNILITLASATSPVSFRELVRRSKVGIRSAQLAVKKLSDEKLLIVKKFKNQKLYKLNDSPALEEVRLIAEHRKTRLLKEKAKLYSKNLKEILKRTDELVNFSIKLKELNSN